MQKADKEIISIPRQHRYVDFHTHILPGIDDGSKNVDESLQMLDTSLKEGILCTILTPHFYPSHDSIHSFLYKRDQAYDRLKQAMTNNYPLLRVGAEVQYFCGISQADELDKLKIQDSELILIEMPFRKWTDDILSEIKSINERPGFRVVIAHIERYLSFLPKGTLDRLVSQDILIQSKPEFFNNIFTAHRAIDLLKSHKIDIIGSDCHNMKSRPPGLERCYSKIRSELGETETYKIIQKGLKLLINGKTSLDKNNVHVKEAVF